MVDYVCPVWIGYLLASPVRRWFNDPQEMLSPYVRAGMTALDVGCAMGFFSIPMAQMVGGKGRVICVDLQEKMLRSLKKRAQKAGVLDRTEIRSCTSHSLGIEDLQERVDFGLAFAMVHEVPDINALFTQLHRALRPGARLLVAEPKGHVSTSGFADTLNAAAAAGLSVVERAPVPRTHSVLLQKPPGLR